MSGIFGVIDNRRPLSVDQIISKMSNEMNHCDWNVIETHTENKIGVGLGRIGIGIFNKESQPVWNSKRTVAIVMSGEFYNSNELDSCCSEKSDVHTALALYENLGEDFVRTINGAFIIAIMDKTCRKILIANDRFGLYQLFYSCHAGRLIFSPEVKGILCDNNLPRKLDLTALTQYMRFQHLLGDRTFLENIKLFPNASILTYDIFTTSHCIKTYWKYNDIPFRPDIKFHEAVEETGYLLRNSIKRLSSDVYRPGVYLSGGLDSRTVIGMIERRPLISLTFGENISRDVCYAQKISKAVGSEHYWFEFIGGNWVIDYIDFHMELTEGFHSWIHAHGINTLSEARRLMDVTLTGWDGGTVMGHRDNIEPLQISAVDDLAFITRMFYLFTNKYTWPSITEAEENLLYSDKISKKVCKLAFESFQTEISHFLNDRSDVRGEYFYLSNHCRRLTQNMINFTRSHIEVRFPFFDYDLFDYLYSLYSPVRGHRRLYGAVIQNEIPKLAFIPYDRDEFLPTSKSLIRELHAIMIKFKRRFNRHFFKIFSERHTLYADYENYLRKDLRHWAEGILFDKRTLERGIFNQKYIRSIWNHHLSGNELHTIGKIAPIMTYEMMIRRLFD